MGQIPFSTPAPPDATTARPAKRTQRTPLGQDVGPECAPICSPRAALEFTTPQNDRQFLAPMTTVPPLPVAKQSKTMVR